MAKRTNIEWVRNPDGSKGETWNPVTGCDRVSPACDHCYALSLAPSIRARQHAQGIVPSRYEKDGDPRTSGPAFGLTMHPDLLEVPLRWAKPRTVFVNSMSDLFHADVSDEFIAEVWAVMAIASRHTFQVLTKRQGRLRSLLSSPVFADRVSAAVARRLAADRAAKPALAWPLPNVWVGVSAENQTWADARIPALLDTPAAIRFVSAEPLLGPVNLSMLRPERGRGGLFRDAFAGQTDPGTGRVDGPGLDWVIVGGESGPEARPMHSDWVRGLRDQCLAAQVPFFFKQWGAWLPTHSRDPRYRGPVKGGYWSYEGTWAAFTLDGVPRSPDWVLRVGKREAGRVLDGQTWDYMPAFQPVEGSGAAAHVAI